MPENIAGIQHRCGGVSHSGFFASVAVVNAENLNLPPYRGHGMHVRFTGLFALKGTSELVWRVWMDPKRDADDDTRLNDGLHCNDTNKERRR